MYSANIFSSSNTALITGAASGIGLAVAQLCKSHGMKLALVDINSTHLSKAKEIIGGSAEVETYEVDVSKADQWASLRDQVKAQFGGPPDLLMLNAAVGGPGSWGDAQYFRRILDTNLFGVINGLNTFVPDYKAANSQNPCAIVLTGSKQGITNPPGNPAYNASKAAVKSLAEQLSYEFRDTKTTVHLLVPGWTYTGLTGGGPSSAKEKPAGAWEPKQVADYLYKKIGEGKFYIICPDNDVNEETDKKRMLYSIGDIISERLPLSRWRDESKAGADEWMKVETLERYK